jgi:hypothetical protein
VASRGRRDDIDLVSRVKGMLFLSDEKNLPGIRRVVHTQHEMDAVLENPEVFAWPRLQ